VEYKCDFRFSGEKNKVYHSYQYSIVKINLQPIVYAYNTIGIKIVICNALRFSVFMLPWSMSTVVLWLYTNCISLAFFEKQSYYQDFFGAYSNVF